MSVAAVLERQPNVRDIETFTFIPKENVWDHVSNLDLLINLSLYGIEAYVLLKNPDAYVDILEANAAPLREQAKRAIIDGLMSYSDDQNVTSIDDFLQINADARILSRSTARDAKKGLWKATMHLNELIASSQRGNNNQISSLRFMRNFSINYPSVDISNEIRIFMKND